MNSIIDRWDITIDELTELIDTNPSLRGMIFGYLSEFKVRNLWFSPPKVRGSYKPDDHDRGQKCDLVIDYEGFEIKVEVKSLQMNSIKESKDGQVAIFQCDASDKRSIILPSGERLATTCIKVTDFEIVAVNLFGFCQRWEFAFARSTDLEITNFKKYPEAIRSLLLKGNQTITYPIVAPFVNDPFPLIKAIVRDRRENRQNTAIS